MRLFVLLPGSIALAKKPPYADIEVVRVVSVYDGDTLRVDLSCSQPLFCDNVSVRIRGIDTPEIRGKCDYEEDVLKPGVVYPFICSLLSLHEISDGEPLVEVILLSRNDPNTGLRVMNCYSAIWFAYNPSDVSARAIA